MLSFLLHGKEALWRAAALTPCSLQNTENLPSHLTRGNLSVLKKKWENPALGAESGKETIRSSFAEVRHKGAGAASGQQQCPLGDSTEPQGHSRHSGSMENCGREMEKAESSERSESPGRIEKYNVPLNKLKMMFEKGEATQLKVRICPCHSSERKKKKKKAAACSASGKSPEGVAAAIDSANIVVHCFSGNRTSRW